MDPTWKQKVELSVSEYLQSEVIHWTPLSGGKNNKLWKLSSDEADKAQHVVVKSYFFHPEDPRDRFSHEVTFLSYCQQNKIRSVPHLLVADRDLRVTAMSVLPGRQLLKQRVTWEHIEQVLNFILLLNEPSIESYPLKASEACFSEAEHHQLISTRLLKLKDLCSRDRLLVPAYTFMTDQLLPYYQAVQQDWDDKLLPKKQFCLSPSDLGFHNILVSEQDDCYFYDFEYAGLDDPAKLACDFLCQQAVPIPEAYHEPFVQSLSEVLNDPTLLQRVSRLIPLYKAKWCCILINSCCALSAQRRAFSETEVFLDQQLYKAEELLKHVTLT